MDITGLVFVSGLVAVMVLGTLGGLIIAFVKAYKGFGGSVKQGRETADETALIQEIHRGLLKMSERVETLETLLVEEERLKRSEFESRLDQD